MTDIGEEYDALICLTNSTECCEEDSGVIGEWYFPNSSQVPVNDHGYGMYVSRGPSVVRLHRRNNTIIPTGVFHCEISDANEANQSIYVGVYPADHKGAGIVMNEMVYMIKKTFHVGSVIAEDLTFDKRQLALSCTSTGGPPTTVSWMKDGQPLTIDGTNYQQRQIITNASSSTYVTTVFIRSFDKLLHKTVGNYTCLVSNSRVTSNGSNQRTDLEIQGQ